MSLAEPEDLLAFEKEVKTKKAKYYHNTEFLNAIDQCYNRRKSDIQERLDLHLELTSSKYYENIKSTG